MRSILSLLLAVLICSAQPLAQDAAKAPDDSLVGAWSGTFTGDASGKFSMAIARDAAKKLGGTLEASPDGGEGYKTSFKTVAADGAKVTMAYDSPDGNGNEIQLEGALEGTALKGTWKVVDPAKAVLQSGTFASTKA